MSTVNQINGPAKKGGQVDLYRVLLCSSRTYT